MTDDPKVLFQPPLPFFFRLFNIYPLASLLSNLNKARVFIFPLINDLFYPLKL